MRGEAFGQRGEKPSDSRQVTKGEDKIMILKIVLILLAVIVALFLLLFCVYFFNLDMKLIVNVIAPILEKYHDKKKHDQFV